MQQYDYRIYNSNKPIQNQKEAKCELNIATSQPVQLSTSTHNYLFLNAKV